MFAVRDMMQRSELQLQEQLQELQVRAPLSQQHFLSATLLTDLPVQPVLCDKQCFGLLGLSQLYAEVHSFESFFNVSWHPGGHVL